MSPELVVAPCQLKVPKKTLSSALACKEYWRAVIADLILKSPTCVPSQLIWYTASTVEARTAKSPASSGLGDRSFGFSALVCFGSAGFAGGLASAGFVGAGLDSATGVCGFASFGSAAAPSGFAGASEADFAGAGFGSASGVCGFASFGSAAVISGSVGVSESGSAGAALESA